MSIKDANVAITIGGDSKQFRRELKKADDSLGAFNKKANKIVANLGKVGAAATAAGGAMVAALYASQKDVIDSMAKTADALSMTTESLQALNHLAGLSGVETKALNNSLQKMQKTLGDAARKGGIAADALEGLGVNLDSILQLSPDQQLVSLSKAFSSVQDNAVKASLASEIFGRNGLRMLKVMNQLSDEGLDPTIESLERMGATLTRVDAAKVEDANDAMEKARVAAAAMSQAMTVALAPAVEAVANKFVSWAESTGGLVNKIKEFEPQIKVLLEIGKALAIVYGSALVGAMGRYAVAQALMIKNTIKQITYMKALDVAATGLKRGLSLLGGPLGLVTLAATSLMAFGKSAEEALPPSRDLADVINELADSYENMSERAKKAALAELELSLAAKKEELATQQAIIKAYDDEEKEIRERERSLREFIRLNENAKLQQQWLKENLQEQLDFDKTRGHQRTIALGQEEKIKKEIQEAVEAKRQLLELGKVEAEQPQQEIIVNTGAQQAVNDEKLEAQRQYQEDRYYSQLSAGRDLVQLSKTQAEEDLAAFHSAQFAKIQALKESEVTQTGIIADNAEKQRQIQQQKMQAAFNISKNMLSNISTLMQSENKKEFEMGKKAAKAGAMVDGIAAAVGSYKAGAKIGGPVLGAAFAATSLLATKQMISDLNSQTFSGGSSSAGAVSAPAAAPAAPAQESTFTVSGLNPTSLFSGEQVAEMLRDYQQNGGRLIIE